jgi:hypothetical protein
MVRYPECFCTTLKYTQIGVRSLEYVAPERELSMLVGGYLKSKLLQEGQSRQRLVVPR